MQKQVTNDTLKELCTKLPAIIGHSRSDNTKKRYEVGFNNWFKWTTKFPEVSAFPAISSHFALYMVNLIQENSSLSVIESSFYAIKWYHKSAGLEDPTESFLCVNILEAAKRLCKEPAQRKEPITTESIQKVYTLIGRDTANLLDLRNYVIIVLGFAGFLRFNEIANIRRSNVEFFTTFMKIFITESKTDVYRDGKWSYIAKSNSSLCPVSTLQSYLQRTNIPGDSDEFLFRSMTYFKKSDEYKLRNTDKPASYSTIRQSVLKLLERIGLNRKEFGLHSLRSGGASAAANNGVQDRLFKRHGRWKTENIKDTYVKDDIDHLLSVSLNLGL